ncbi:MAG TPA: hypothetical protein VFO60_05905, partial [Candidatus Dormibacteraeota bacterium]|nr:hypothetical protein [Candidatus Dormibacteraeota bacterium]
MHLPVGAACAVVAVAAVALSLGAPEPAWQRAVISALTSTMLAGAVVLVRDSRRGRVRVLGGELIVDAAFADIVVVLASRPAGAPLRAAEFVVALAGLAAGTAALALAPLARGGVAAAVRAAVTVVTGAVLAAVAAGQLERPGFAVSWSWTPFLAFAVPGMLAVLGAEVAGRSRTSRRLTILSGAARVAGVALLLYGSV